MCVELRAESKVSVRKGRKSQWRPVARQVRSFLGQTVHRYTICKSSLVKKIIILIIALRICRTLLLCCRVTMANNKKRKMIRKTVEGNVEEKIEGRKRKSVQAEEFSRIIAGRQAEE